MIYEELLKALPQLPSVDASIMLNVLYDISYGIYNHRKVQAHPFAKVAAHPTESILEGSRYERSLSRFMECMVYEQTGISFKEALDMPVYQFKQTCDKAYEALLAKSKATNAAMSGILDKNGMPIK